MKDFFKQTGFDGRLNQPTFIKAISRLRGKLKECGIFDIIESTSYKGEMAYYINDAYSFVVMYRVDDVFELDW